MFVCNCFGVTEEQVRQHVVDGACTPRQIASACRAGTDCGSCVRRIQALLGRGSCPRRDLVDQGRPALTPDQAPPPALVPTAPAPTPPEPSAPVAPAPAAVPPAPLSPAATAPAAASPVAVPVLGPAA